MAIRVILCILSVCMTLQMAAADTDSGLLAEELTIAKERLENENSRLRQELKEKDAEIEKIRGMYADMMLKSNETVNHLTNMEITAANLLGSTGKDENQLTEILAVTAMLREKLLEVDEEIGRLAQNCTTLMEVLKPSESMKQLMDENLKKLKKSVADSMKILCPEKKHAKDKAWSSGCEILRLDSDLQVVFLAGGTRQNLRNGQILEFDLDGVKKASLRLVECRAEDSAAVLLDGDWKTLFVGCMLYPKQIGVQVESK